MNLTRTTVVATLGIVLLVGPALFPVQPMLYHYSGAGTTDSRAELEAKGHEIIAYENLSDRGKELYRKALKNDRYAVPRGTGAPEFSYPTATELSETEDRRSKQQLQSVVIERPPDADLPPADEPVEIARERREERREARERREAEGERPTPTAEQPRETESRPSIEQMREQIRRYDVLTTRTERPPVTAQSSLLRLLSAMLGVVLVGVGGYLTSKP